MRTVLKFLYSEVIFITLAHFHKIYLIIINISEIYFCLVEDDLKIEQAVGMGNGILLTWNYDPNMTCDYVIKWCNSSQSKPCLMDWKKVPSNSTQTVIESGKYVSEFFKNIFKKSNTWCDLLQ